MLSSNALFLLLASHSLAAPTEKQETPKAGVLQLPVFQVPTTNKTQNKALTRRQVSTEVDQFYYQNHDLGALGTVIEIGTPPQRVIVEPDTGSDLLWVPSLQPGHQREGVESTFFDAKSSSSIKDIGKSITYKYSDESIEARGYWDDVSIGGQFAGRMIVGVADLDGPGTKVGRHVGVLPLRPSRGDDQIFMPRKLFSQGIVKSTAFGLGVRQHGQGSLTFGGYDASKFSGPLEKHEMNPQSKHVSLFIDHVSFNPGGGGEDLVIVDKHSRTDNSVDMGLDSGTPALYLPPSLKQDFMTKTGSTMFSGEMALFDCQVVDSGAALNFHIRNNVTVSIPLSDFVFGRYSDGKCGLAVTFRPSPANYIFIGRHFFRRAYVVHDLDNRLVYVARGADCGSTVVAIDGTMPDDVVGNCAHEEPGPDQPAPLAPGAVQPAPVHNWWFNS